MTWDAYDTVVEDSGHEARSRERQALSLGIDRPIFLDWAGFQGQVSYDGVRSARELWERMLHSLSHQGISKEAYRRIAGRSEEDIVAEARPDAEQALRREAVIAAVVEAEAIEPAEGDVLEALQAGAARENASPEELRDRLEKAGRLDDLRDDLAQRAAVDFLAEHATAISVEQAKARDKLWTPGSERSEQGSAQLWTPGS